MKRSLFGVVALGAWLLLGGGCSSTKENAADTTRRCTPGNNVACLCADGQAGTHMCNDDGQTFGECRLNVGVECPGGEKTCTDGETTDCTCDDGQAGKFYCESGSFGSGCMLSPTEECPTVTKDAGAAVDSCPGQDIAVNEGAPTVIADDTSTASNNANGADGTACGNGTGPDHIYKIVPSATGTITAKITPESTFDATLYLRPDCVMTASQRCAESGAPGKEETLTANVIANTPYYIFVDGKAGSKGKYSLSVSIKSGGFCGDGKVSGTEVCDDKNNVDGDGCGAGCNNVNGDPTSGGSCPGQVVNVYTSEVTGTGSTTGFGNTFTADDAPCNNGSAVNAAQDHVYAVTAHKNGTMTVKTTAATFKTMLVARSECTATAAAKRIACKSSQGTGANDATITFPVNDGGTYYVAVDGAFSSDKGTYTISFRIQ